MLCVCGVGVYIERVAVCVCGLRGLVYIGFMGHLISSNALRVLASMAMCCECVK